MDWLGAAHQQHRAPCQGASPPSLGLAHGTALVLPFLLPSSSSSSYPRPPLPFTPVLPFFALSSPFPLAAAPRSPNFISPCQEGLRERLSLRPGCFTDPQLPGLVFGASPCPLARAQIPRCGSEAGEALAAGREEEPGGSGAGISPLCSLFGCAPFPLTHHRGRFSFPFTQPALFWCRLVQDLLCHGASCSGRATPWAPGSRLRQDQRQNPNLVAAPGGNWELRGAAWSGLQRDKGARWLLGDRR